MSLSPPVPIGLLVARLAEQLVTSSVIFVAANDQRAETVASCLVSVSADRQTVLLPSSDSLPGEAAASPRNTGCRVAALRALRGAEGTPVALVTTAEAMAALYPPPEAFDSRPPELVAGAKLELDELVQMLRDLGYIDDDQVDEPGMVAVRGQVVDLYPADAAQPVRIELQDGTIAAIRAFDPVSQLTTSVLERLDVGRIEEPLLGSNPMTVLDHLLDAAVMFDGEAQARFDRYLALVNDVTGGRNPGVIDLERLNSALAGRTMMDNGWGAAQSMTRFVEDKAPVRKLLNEAKVAATAGAHIVIVGAERDIRFVARRLNKALSLAVQPLTNWSEVGGAAPGTLNTLQMVVDRGWREDGLFALAAADVLGGRALLHGATTGAAEEFLGAVEDLRVGDVVIHEDFGVSVVAGLEPMAGSDAAGEAIVLTFAADGRRQVPAADADRLWRYGAEADAVTLDKLDGTGWHERRAVIDAAIAETARGLTALAAERSARTAPMLEPDAAAYERFSAGFAFTETVDQARAIAMVRSDLASGRPVDRLVIGDVGYGKTEVALRATALAALAGYQVVIAAPTTVLVRQHLEVFRKRFAGTGVEVAGLSRLSTPAERKATLAGLADGSIRVVVGTAAVAGKAVSYGNLALVVIDEEQRFGAADKSRLRALSDSTHLLTLTATPIPRTLQTALIGIQQLSVIATPPVERRPIRTIATGFEPAQVRAALLREKSRRGQSFVVVPRIEDMATMRQRLGELVPELTFVEAHGKLPAAQIDAAMVGFANGEGDVLLATNIIEAGLDVPRANTMIVWRADRFGLSQQHQLRGRVGRGSRRGQVLLLTDPASAVAPQTIKRLQTLETFDRLGAGFAISARDLDVRGAGDLLGDEQAGHVKLIGVGLYQHLLEAALRTARGEIVDDWRPELNLGLAGCFPEAWVPDVDVRLPLYVRLARLRDHEALDTFAEELEDRFGALPNAARMLLETTRVGLLCRSVGIERVDAGPAAIALTPKAGFGNRDMVGLTRKNGRWLLAERLPDVDVRLSRLVSLLEGLDD